MPTSDNDYIFSEISKMSEWTLKGQRLWSFLNNGSSITIISFSAIAAVLTQADYNLWHTKCLSTFLSLVVTIISAIQTKIGFEQKWAANRSSQSALRQLLVDVKNGEDPKKISETFKSIIETHDRSIIAASVKKIGQ